MEWEQEIDLRVYIAILVKYKFWIGGLAVICAIAALGISLLLSPSYEAQALVVITEPAYTMQFDSRFEEQEIASLPYKAYPAIATSDEVIAALVDWLGDRLPEEERTVSRVRKMLTAAGGADPSIIALKVQNGDPQLTADIVNQWAALFVQHANAVYGQGEQEVAFFQAQVEEAQSALDEAEQALIDFQARNESRILNAQLSSKQASLDETLRVSRSAEANIQDARALQDRLRAQDAMARTSLGDELTALFLQVDALNRKSLPIQLQISGSQGLGDRTAGEQIAYLDSLIQALENKLVVLDLEGQALEPDLLDLQKQIQKVSTERDRLQRTANLARETYLALARKVAEVQISAQDTVSSVRLASKAYAPDRPVSPKKLLNTAIAGALGLLIGIVGALGLEYWRQGQGETSAAA